VGKDMMELPITIKDLQRNRYLLMYGGFYFDKKFMIKTVEYKFFNLIKRTRTMRLGTKIWIPKTKQILFNSDIIFSHSGMMKDLTGENG
jgi:hypothetical protein